MKTYVSSLWCLLVVFDYSSSEFVNICLSSAQTTPITCGENSVIRVAESTAAHFPNLVQCGSDVTSLPENFPAGCRTEQKQVFYSCHGHHSCELQRSWIYASVPGCFQGTRTNFLLVEYSCLTIESTKAAIPIYRDVISPTLQVFSPGFPNPMPVGEYNFSCTVTAADPAIQGTFEVQLKRMFVKLESSSVYCAEKLHFTASEATLRICSDGDGYEEWNRSNKAEGFATENTFRMNYTKDKEGFESRFWVQMSGFKDGEPINLKITCPDEIQIPGYSPPPETTSTTPTTTITPRNGMGYEQNMEDSKDVVLYGIIGAVAGFILIVVLIIIIVICKFKKRKKNDQRPETADTADARQGNIALYSNATDPESTPETFTTLESRTKVKENVYHEEADAMYSTVKDNDVNEPSSLTTVGNGNVAGAYAAVEDPPTIPGMKSADNDEAMYATVDDDDVKKPKAVANGAIGGVYADVDDSPKPNKKIIDNDIDGSTYATVDEHDNKLENKDKNEGDNGPAEMYAVVDKSMKNKDENYKGNDKSDDEEHEMYTTVNKGNKKEETGIMGPENEETIMCENEDIYEESEKTKEEKETTEDDNEIYDTVNTGDKKDDSGLQGPESEDTIMCENEDLYEAPEDVKGQEKEGQSKETGGQKQETEGQGQETGPNHETEGQDQETEVQRHETEGQGQEKRKLNHGYENVRRETE